MVYTYAECLEKWGSAYQISKAVQRGELYQLEKGVYSDEEYVTTLEIVTKKYPNAVMTMDTAFYYHGLTDVIPDDYCMATVESSSAYRDTRIRQMFVREDIFDYGVITIEHQGVNFKIYDRERMLIELLRFKNKLPYDYYKEILHNYRDIIHKLDIERIQYYAECFPKSKMISEALDLEVF